MDVALPVVRLIPIVYPIPGIHAISAARGFRLRMQHETVNGGRLFPYSPTFTSSFQLSTPLCGITGLCYCLSSA